jgi:phosphoserine phosphatase
MKLIAFDFDGTLSDSEMTVLLGEREGVADEMADITERAMNDEISYAKSLRERAALLEGLEEERAEEAYGEVTLRPGAAALLRRLHDYGHHVAILTGGFERGVERALEREGVRDAVDTVVANRLVVKGGRLTGGVEGPLVEGTKDRELERLGEELGVKPGQTVAIGDGANDLPMLEVAGFAVGYLPKEAVRPHCDTVVASMDRLAAVFEERGVLHARE